MRTYRLMMLWCAACLGAMVAIVGCGDDDDDDNDNDDADDDDDDTSPDDDDNDVSPDDDDDDDTPSGPAPLIDNLILTPAEGFAGDAVAMSFHFQDLEGDVNGGTVELFLDGVSVATLPAVTAGDNQGYVDFGYTLPADLAEGDILIEVTVTDVGQNTSNKIGSIFESSGVNTAPSISNLRYDPDPACNSLSAVFSIILDYHDAEANLDGSYLNIIINNSFPPLTAQLQGSNIPPEGTLQLDLTPGVFTNNMPNGEVVNFKLQLYDNRLAPSNIIGRDLEFNVAACD
jgi:hypothetical protein